MPKNLKSIHVSIPQRSDFNKIYKKNREVEVKLKLHNGKNII